MARRHSLTVVSVLFFIGFFAEMLLASTGYDALHQPVNARAVGMNGAYVAHSGEPSALFWNPAGLSTVEQIIGEMSYENHLLDVDGTELGLALPFWTGGAGFGINFWNYGEFERRDDQGNISGSPATASEFWLTGGYGHQLDEYNSLGVNMQLFVRSFDANKSTLLLWSVGWQRFFPEQRLRVGIVAAHWGTTVSSYQDDPEALPRQLNAGLSKRLLYLPLKLHLDVRYAMDDNDVRGMLGGEFTITESENLFLRLGITSDRFDQITQVVGADFLAGGSFGFGFRYQFLQFDYGAQSFGGAGLVHAFTLRSVF